jgi:UDP-GlcNAc:undecaprenyl-phosphate GlcNAc-1-phosphate transferase
MTLNLLLLGFAFAFMGCVLAIPVITRLAGWIGAIDAPDHFRRIHTRSIPRMGGFGLAVGLFVSVPLLASRAGFHEWSGFDNWWSHQAAVGLAAALILLVGLLDDSRGLSPRVKLLGQACAVLVLYLGGIRIDGVEILGTSLSLSAPVPVHLPWSATNLVIDPPSFAVTLLWFLGCMNTWNLIDGMDGLASGVGLIVAGTLMLVAVHNGNLGSAVLAAALVGSLAGFLLYNWHPACIFLGDSGSLLLGLLLGVIGVQDSMKGTTAVSILFPVLAMGLPICDTAMAIFRRWLRDLPLSAADRRHIHHLLIGLGLTTRQAAIVLYLFTAGLCGVVMLGVAWRNDMLALVLGLSGCFAFLLVLTSRRDELTQLLSDLRARRGRRRQERTAARTTWDWIQRIELCDAPERVLPALEHGARELGAAGVAVRVQVGGLTLAEFDRSTVLDFGSGHLARFLVREESQTLVELVVRQQPAEDRDADILFRSAQKLAEVAARRIAGLAEWAPVHRSEPVHSASRAEPDRASRASPGRPWLHQLAVRLREGCGL